MPTTWRRTPISTSQHSIGRAVVLERRTVHIHGSSDEPSTTSFPIASSRSGDGQRTTLAVPLLREGDADRRCCHRSRHEVAAVHRAARSRCWRRSRIRRSSPSRTPACSRSWSSATDSGEQPPGHRGAGAADGDRRGPARHRLLANRPPAGPGDHRPERRSRSASADERHHPAEVTTGACVSSRTTTGGTIRGRARDPDHGSRDRRRGTVRSRHVDRRTIHIDDVRRHDVEA